MAKLGISEKSVISSVLLVPILISPNVNLDPVNIIKLSCIVVCSLIAFSSMLGKLQSELRVRLNVVKLTLLTFTLLGPLLFSGADKVSQFYGTFGRNTGFLAILTLVLTYLAVRFSDCPNFLESVLWACLASAFVTCSYGMLQYTGLDPLDWPKIYPGIFSTLGNPNFFGSHAALAFTISFLLLVLKRHRRSKLEKNFLVLMCFLTLFAVVVSNSLQGIVLVCFALIYAFVSLVSMKGHLASNRIVAMSYLVFSLFSFVVVLAFNSLSPSIFDANLNSLIVRIEYMRAGISMILSNPVLGVGWDQFGDWYMKYRSDRAYFGGDFGEYSDSSHNIWIDFGTFGGFPALLFFVFFLLATLKLTSKLVSLSESNHYYSKLVLAAAMHGFVLQSFISVGNLSLTIWGAVFAALVARECSVDKVKSEKLLYRTKVESSQLKRNKRIGAWIGGLLALFLVSPLFLKDASVLSAQNAENVKEFADSIVSFPKLPYYYYYGISTLEDAGYYGKASIMSISGVDQFPNSRLILQRSRTLKSLDSLSKSKIQLELDRLNPPRSKAQS